MYVYCHNIHTDIITGSCTSCGGTVTATNSGDRRVLPDGPKLKKLVITNFEVNTCN